MQLTDEILSSYMDGELDPETRAAVEESLAIDPASRALIRDFREEQAVLQNAFNAPLEEPAPARLTRTINRHRIEAPGRGRWRRGAPSWNPQWALAAGLIAGLGIGAGLVFTQVSGPSNIASNAVLHPLYDNAIGAALESTPSGSSTRASEPGPLVRRIEPRLSFQARDGRYCREFSERIEDTRRIDTGNGVACRGAEGRWVTEFYQRGRSMARQPNPGPAPYVPAGATDTELVDKFINRLGGTGPLDLGAEKDLIRSRWSGSPAAKKF